MRASKIVKAALSGGCALTRAALYGQLDAQGIETGQQRGMRILWWLALEGLICCGPRVGKQHTFVLLDEWIPAPSSLTREEALASLAQRYFARHGPATLADFVWWSGLTRVAAGHGIFRAPIVIAGSIVGSWTREIKKDRVDIRVVPLTRFDREQLRCIDEGRAATGTFWGSQRR
jgi:hypothetical protein